MRKMRETRGMEVIIIHAYVIVPVYVFKQCCGSGMFIHPGSRILDLATAKIIKIKQFSLTGTLRKKFKPIQ
jgi:hypothetical protein